MQINPGDGYTFTSSASGHNLSIIKPWAPYVGPNFSPKPLQFEVRQFKKVSTNTAAIQIAKGAVNFDQSNMPEVWGSPATSRRQIYMQKVAVIIGDITAVDGGIPQGQTSWLDNGGYYTLPGNGFYYVTISKMDIDGTLTAGGVSDSPLIQTNRPFISIFASTNALYSKIFQQTGPSQYVNRTNVQRMDGYDSESTGLDYDFGACHTTWFNPVKYGYDCKIIATIEVTTDVIDGISYKKLDIRQHAVGSINMNIPLQYLGSTLHDIAGEVEADDPYNLNEENSFNFIVNSSLRTSLNTITARTTTFFTDMLGPEDWTNHQYEFYETCSGDTCAHPFQVKWRTGEGGTEWKVCPGSVNNEMLPEGDWSTATTDGFIVLRCQFDGTNYPAVDGVSVNFHETIPDDTDEYGRIAIAQIVDGVVTQLVTGSLWSDRIKMGDDTATYYFARV